MAIIIVIIVVQYKHTIGQHHFEASQIVKIVNFLNFNKTYDLYCFMSCVRQRPLRGLCAFLRKAKISTFIFWCILYCFLLVRKILDSFLSLKMEVRYQQPHDNLNAFTTFYIRGERGPSSQNVNHWSKMCRHSKVSHKIVMVKTQSISAATPKQFRKPFGFLRRPLLRRIVSTSSGHAIHPYNGQVFKSTLMKACFCKDHGQKN